MKKYTNCESNRYFTMVSFFITQLLLAIAQFVSTVPIADDHCGEIPPDFKPTPIATLPDPFLFINGDRVESKSDYRCRQRQISKLIQQYELGTKPSDPDNVTSSFTNNTLTITVTEREKSITFKAPITYPTTGKAPYPAIIAVGLGGLNIKPAQPEGVAIINFDNDQMGVTGLRCVPRKRNFLRSIRKRCQRRLHGSLGVGREPNHRCSGEHT